MNLFKQFLELVPGADPLLVGTVTAVGATTTTLQTMGGGVVVVRGGRGGHRPEGVLPEWCYHRARS
nr:hypothetical protein [Aeromonas caviae]